MRPAPLMILVASAGVARADGDAEIRETSSLMMEGTGPWLELDPQLPTKLESFDAHRERESTTVEVTRKLKLKIDGEWWWSGQRMLGGGRIADRDIAGHGWTAGARIAYDLGPVELEAGVSESGIDTAYGAGRYRDYSVSATHRFRWPYDMPGWISLSANHRTWVTEPPKGEPRSETTITLMIGWAF